MHSPSNKALSPTLVVAALGVVYGDIGTSPLYAFKESIAGEHGAGVTHANVLGVLSMIFWAITLVVSVKYVLIVLRANNGGEGGILALTGPGAAAVPGQGRGCRASLSLGLFGAAMFYGDSIITPAISVLSADRGPGGGFARVHAIRDSADAAGSDRSLRGAEPRDGRVGNAVRSDHGRLVRRRWGSSARCRLRRNPECWPRSIPCMPSVS